MSPTLSILEGFTNSPLTLTLEPLQEAPAKDRVLKASPPTTKYQYEPNLNYHSCFSLFFRATHANSKARSSPYRLTENFTLFLTPTLLDHVACQNSYFRFPDLITILETPTTPDTFRLVSFPSAHANRIRKFLISSLR